MTLFLLFSFDLDQVVLNVTFNTPLWTLGGWDQTQCDNPWQDGGANAPFDQDFYIIFNLACGGTGAQKERRICDFFCC